MTRGSDDRKAGDAKLSSPETMVLILCGQDATAPAAEDRRYDTMSDTVQVGRSKSSYEFQVNVGGEHKMNAPNVR